MKSSEQVNITTHEQFLEVLRYVVQVTLYIPSLGDKLPNHIMHRINAIDRYVKANGGWQQVIKE